MKHWKPVLLGAILFLLLIFFLPEKVKVSRTIPRPAVPVSPQPQANPPGRTARPSSLSSPATEPEHMVIEDHKIKDPVRIGEVITSKGMKIEKVDSSESRRFEQLLREQEKSGNKK